MADGGITGVRAGGVSVVSPLAAAVPALNIDGAPDDLDYQYFADLRCLALEVART